MNRRHKLPTYLLPRSPHGASVTPVTSNMTDFSDHSLSIQCIIPMSHFSQCTSFNDSLIVSYWQTNHQQNPELGFCRQKPVSATHEVLIGKTGLNQKTQNTSTKVSSLSQQQDFPCILQHKHCNTSVHSQSCQMCINTNENCIRTEAQIRLWKVTMEHNSQDAKV